MSKFNLCIIASMVIGTYACQPAESSTNSANEESSAPYSNNSENLNLNYTVDGEYIYEDGGMRASLTINGGKWRASTYYKTDKGSKFDSSHVEYKTGIIKDKMLYEKSGIIPIRPVERNNIKMNLGGKEVDLVKIDTNLDN
jgi:hypothetical protein